MRSPSGKSITSWFLCILVHCLFFSSLSGQDSATHPPADSVPPLIYEFQLADTSVIFHWHYLNNSRLMFLVIHDDENTSSEIAFKTMGRYNASMVEMKNDNKYLYSFSFENQPYQFNPNRIFSFEGIRNTVGKFGRDNKKLCESISLLSSQITGTFFLDQDFIVALHNNTDQGFSILSYQTDSILKRSAENVFINPELDPDDFFLVINPEHFNILRQTGFNVVLQSSDLSEDDGSLSFWCLKNGIPYVNLEAEHFHYLEQYWMLDLLYDLIIKD
jgi:hypothetical protein